MATALAVPAGVYNVGDEWNGSPVADVASEMSALTLDVVGRVLFGADLVAQAPSLAGRSALGSGWRCWERSCRSPGASLGPVVQVAAQRFGAGAVQQQMERLISRRREQPGAHAGPGGGTAGGGRDGEGPRDLLGLLMAARDSDGSGLSKQEIRDEIATFLVAGHETTAMALTWSLALLSAYPAGTAAAGRRGRRRARERPRRPRQAALDHRGDQRGDAAVPSGLDDRADRGGRR